MQNSNRGKPTLFNQRNIQIEVLDCPNTADLKQNSEALPFASNTYAEVLFQ